MPAYVSVVQWSACELRRLIASQLRQWYVFAIMTNEGRLILAYILRLFQALLQHTLFSVKFLIIPGLYRNASGISSFLFFSVDFDTMAWAGPRDRHTVYSIWPIRIVCGVCKQCDITCVSFQSEVWLGIVYGLGRTAQLALTYLMLGGCIQTCEWTLYIFSYWNFVAHLRTSQAFVWYTDAWHSLRFVYIPLQITWHI